MNQKILLLHGALGTKEQFVSLKEKLEEEFEVHDFDFEGHGGVKSNKEFTIDLFTENVIDYLKVNKIDKTHVFGYSMGGYVGLNVARLYPDLIGKIVTLGTKFAWTKEIAENEIKKLNPEKIEIKVPSFADKLSSIHKENDWKEVVEKTAIMMYGLGNGGKLTEKELGEIKHEVLIGIGSNDRMVGIEESRSAAKILPEGALRVVEDFVHPIDQINKEMLSSIIIDFVK